MKLLAPPLHISETDGFKSELDIFKRKAYGEGLLNLITNTDDELVLALDAPWGEGKSTFIKMWRGLLNEKGISNVYFDAFENDYQQDALLAISSELYALIDKKDDETKSAFKKKAISALKVVGRAGLKIGIKAITAGVLDDSILKDTNNVEDVEDEISDLADQFISEQLTKSEENRKSLSTFKDYLSTLSDKIGNGSKLIFIIDELDRCKPNFALAILENIKHLFSVPNISFVLVMNRVQLEEAVKSEYGQGVDAPKYLQKFISIWTSLPRQSDKYNHDSKIYLNDCLKRMGHRVSTDAHQNASQNLEDLARYYDLSLREIEKTLTNFAIIHNATQEGDLNSSFLILATFIAIIKVAKPNVYQKITRKNISYEQLIIEANLDSLKAKWWDKGEEHPLRWLLKYQLCDDETASSMQSNDRSMSCDCRRDAITMICGWLDSFKQR